MASLSFFLNPVSPFQIIYKRVNCCLFCLWRIPDVLLEKWKWSCSVLADSLQPCGLQPTRLLHPWDFPGKNTGAGCHFLLQGIFPNQVSRTAGRCFSFWATREATWPCIARSCAKKSLSYKVIFQGIICLRHYYSHFIILIIVLIFFFKTTD